VLLGSLVSARATDPPLSSQPAIIELSPASQVKPTEPLNISPDRFRWFGVQGYTGSLSWEVEGAAAGYQIFSTAGKLFGRAEGQAEPTFSDIPANSIVVWGKAGRSGSVKLNALGIVDGKPKTLATQTLQILGASPSPTPTPRPGPSPSPSPSPTPTPVAAGPRYIVVVEGIPSTGSVPVNYLSDIAEKLKAKGHTLRTCNPDTVDGGGKVPADLAPYIQRTNGKKLPVLFIVEDKQPEGRLLFEGELPATSNDFLKLLAEKGG
jgi:hypothetical protein